MRLPRRWVMWVLVAGAAGCTEAPPAPFVEVAAGNVLIYCGLRSDATVSCSHGDLAGTFAKVSAGPYWVCAIDTDQILRCGYPGDMPEVERGFLDLSLDGVCPLCAVGVDGSITCWPTVYGLGPDDALTPIDGEFTRVEVRSRRFLGCGSTAGCGLRADGSIACWGDDLMSSPDYAPVGPFRDFALGFHPCGLRFDGTVACSDAFRSGYAVPDGVFSEIRMGGHHACGLRPSGEITCWAGFRSDPPGGSFVHLDVGPDQACAVTTGGRILCWDDHGSGLGTTCDGSLQCRSRMCGSREGEQYCTRRCGPGQVECPEGFDCLRTTDGSQACWPSS
jgi:hypothetical protein